MPAGPLRDATHRRMLEDSMTQALTTAGVKAVPSHRFLAGSAEVSEAQLRSAVSSAGASHVLISSITGTSDTTRRAISRSTRCSLIEFPTSLSHSR